MSARFNPGRMTLLAVATLLVGALGAMQTVAAVNTTTGSGNWDSAIWSDGVPTADDDVFIQAGHTVTITGLSERVVSSLTVTGVLTHADNDSSEAHKIVLTISNDLTVATGGAIDVMGKGYGKGSGTGKGTSSTGGGSHGGIGGQWGGGAGKTYGSVTAPTTLGSGGTDTTTGHGGPGGGAVILTVGGATTVSGTITADGGTNSITGAGGSVYLTSGTLSVPGGGVIRADGRRNLSGDNGGNGGGGRVAIVLTGTDADFSGVAGTISAYGADSGSWHDSAQGTVYLQTQAQGPNGGTLIVDNNGQSPQFTTINTDLNGNIASTTTVGTVVIRNGARLQVGADDTLIVNGDWTNNAAFTAVAGSVVEFAGASPAQIGGSANTTFEHLRIAEPGKTNTFLAGRTFGVNGLLFLSNVVLRSSSPGTRWNLNLSAATGSQDVREVTASDSEASGGALIVAFDSIGADSNNVNWFFMADPGPPPGAPTNVWTGSGNASVGANWSLGRAPEASDDILLGGWGLGNMTWDAAATDTVASWEQRGPYPGSVTFETRFPGQGSFTNFTVTGNCAIESGFWRHTANPASSSVESNCLHVTIGGNLTIAANGAIDVDARGYGATKGPGFDVNYTAGYGGRGGYWQSARGKTYGTVTAPSNLGSGSANGAGGGFVRLVVAGFTTVSGAISANSHSGGVNGGSGGSIYLTTGTLSVPIDGVIQANSVAGSDYSGGGGRIAVILTASDADFSSVLGKITAYGANGNGTWRGAAGTVYLQTQAQGENGGTLIVDNDGKTVGNADVTTDLNGVSASTNTVGTVVIQNQGRLHIGGDDKLVVMGSWTNAQTYFTAALGSTVEFAGTNAATILNDNAWDNLTIATSGKTVRFEAGKTQTVNGTPVFDNGVTLQSTTPSSAWLLTVPGSGKQPVGAVVVRDSDASGGLTMVAAIGSADLGGNTNWEFLRPAGSLFLLR